MHKFKTTTKPKLRERNIFQLSILYKCNDSLNGIFFNVT